MPNILTTRLTQVVEAFTSNPGNESGVGERVLPAVNKTYRVAPVIPSQRVAPKDIP